MEVSRQAILKVVARARVWYQQLTTGKAASNRELDGMNRLSPRFVRLHLPRVALNPHFIERLVTRPESLPRSLDDLRSTVPIHWNQQQFGDAGKPA